MTFGGCASNNCKSSLSSGQHSCSTEGCLPNLSALPHSTPGPKRGCGGELPLQLSCSRKMDANVAAAAAGAADVDPTIEEPLPAPKAEVAGAATKGPEAVRPSSGRSNSPRSS
eukprot:CAMPEP_0115724314 /NCGR_PEP_ID=MMETSP0272-20121206/80713_1 /TAXON_ID=71861 /ORGANISM="Scrippsiella trochoidea, Strain CCMP3099" /LENGTH=112 /DNA_ID=CAMNT_0003167531 /DNA_START=1 /DNA_END=336 /DNA_ORIENTATION=+